MKYELSAKRLRKALSDKDMKPSELSKQTGIALSSISEYLSGKHCPNSFKAVALAKVLDVKPEWLMGFEVKEESEDDAILRKAMQNERLKAYLVAMARMMLKEEDTTHEDT